MPRNTGNVGTKVEIPTRTGTLDALCMKIENTLLRRPLASCKHEAGSKLYYFFSSVHVFLAQHNILTYRWSKEEFATAGGDVETNENNW